jgi:ribosomal protein L32
MPVKSKGQSLGAKTKKGLASSTKRERSAFESAVKESQKCSNCGGINHNKRPCPQCSNPQPHALPNKQDTPLLAPPKGVDLGTILVRLTNMPTDGNCGYHAIAHHLNNGLSCATKGNCWASVCADMLHIIHFHQDFWEDIFGADSNMLIPTT